MTFEEFKEEFDVFRKIDNAENIATCELRYKEYCLRREDEKYFEPFQNTSSDFIDEYERNLNEIFNLEKIMENQWFFVVRPSFEPECLLVIEKPTDDYLMTLTILEKNYWHLYRENNRVKDVKKIASTGRVINDLGNKIVNVLDEMIDQARKPKSPAIVLDGIQYFLSKRLNGEITVVSKHSPSENSRSAKVIMILKMLIYHLNPLNKEKVVDIEDQIENLIDGITL